MPKKKTTSNRAVIYARYSSHNQRDVSIEQQITECSTYAQQAGLEIVHVYADRAMTGTNDRRPEFQRMLMDAERKKFDVVIAWKSNRMGRNMLQAMVNEERLNEIGVRCLYTEEDFDDTAAGRFALRSMMNVNQFYSENMAEDIIRGMTDNARKCLVAGPLPYGYKKGADGRFEIYPPAAAVVREIFSRVACGDTLISIARDLNRRGIKTSTGREWSRSSFHNLLANERYTGVYIFRDIRTPGGVPQIISEELFWEVQNIIKNKGRGSHKPKGDFLLTGKLFCGHCRSQMVGSSGTSKTGARHYYYICQKRHLEKACDKENVRRDQVEETVARVIKEYVLQDSVIDWIADQTEAYARRQEANSGVALLEDELEGVKRSTKNLLNAIEQGILTETTKARMIELENEQSRLIGKIAAEKANMLIIPRSHIVAGLKLFRDGKVSDKKYQAKLFDTFLSAVYLFDDRLEIVFNFSGGRNKVDVPLLLEREGENLPRSSYKLSEPRPKVTQTNPTYGIYMLGPLFVLVCPFERT